MIKIKYKHRIILLIAFFWLASVSSSYALTIAVVKSRDIDAYNQALEGFKKAVNNSSVSWLELDLEGKKELSQAERSSIENSKPALIFTIGSTATAVAQQEFKDTPIVFSMVFNPVASGFVDSMISSGTNITGASLDIPIESQFRNLRLVVPRARNIGVIYGREENSTLIKQAQTVARRMGLNLIAVPVISKEDVSRALDTLINRIDALWAISDSTVFTPNSTQSILQETLRNQVPFMGLSNSYVKAGALLAVACDYKDIGCQSGEIAVKIINGSNPSSIPVATPREVALSLNLIAAEQLGIKIPSNIIAKAKKVFK